MPRSRSAKASQPLPDPSKQEEELSGLYLFGTIIDRTRRIINTKSNNSTAEIVTYTIRDSAGRRYYVDEYSPEGYHDLSEYTGMPVYVKTFKKRSGDIGYSFCVQQEYESTRGEHF